MKKKLLVAVSVFALLGFALTLTTNLITQNNTQPTIIEEANDAPPIDQPKLPL